MKKAAFFLLAVAVSFVAAGYRWGDSAHSIGIIREGGGEARHPSSLDSGGDGYTLISTATVLPPYFGDVRVILEGTPRMDYSIYLSGPAIDVGVRRLPRLKGDTIYGLRPGDRPALWVLMKPPAVDPVCGMECSGSPLTRRYRGRKYAFCSDECMKAFAEEPGRYKDNAGVKGRYTLSFYDTKMEKPVLTVPVIFKGKGEARDDGGHHH